MSKITDFFTKKYLEWQTSLGQRKTLEEFADYLEVNRPLLSYWMNGKRVPSEDNYEKISLRLGNEFYDAMDLPRPNADLQRINRLWEFIPESVQRKLAQEAAKYEEENIASGFQKVSQRKKARGTE